MITIESTVFVTANKFEFALIKEDSWMCIVNVDGMKVKQIVPLTEVTDKDQLQDYFESRYNDILEQALTIYGSQRTILEIFKDAYKANMDTVKKINKLNTKVKTIESRGI